MCTAGRRADGCAGRVRGRTMDLGRRVAALAARQHGLVTFGQLLRLGVGRRAVQHRVATGRLHRVHLGVYAVGHDAICDAGRLLAAVMACGNEAALSHVHAAVVWRLLPPWVETSLIPTHVTVPPGSGKGRRPRILIHRSRLPRTEVEVEDAIPITSVARTVLDLAEVRGTRELERLVDQAITNGQVTVAKLHAVTASHPGRHGAAAVRRLLATAERFDSLTQSELEEAFAGLVRAGGLGSPALNRLIDGMKIDAIWRAERVAVELDGYRWHRTRHRQEADRDREARLRRLGWFPVRYSARQVFDQPLIVIADLAAVLAGSRS